MADKSRGAFALPDQRQEYYAGDFKNPIALAQQQAEQDALWRSLKGLIGMGGGMAATMLPANRVTLPLALGAAGYGAANNLMVPEALARAKRLKYQGD